MVQCHLMGYLPLHPVNPLSGNGPLRSPTLLFYYFTLFASGNNGGLGSTNPDNFTQRGTSI